VLRVLKTREKREKNNNTQRDEWLLRARAYVHYLCVSVLLRGMFFFVTGVVMAARLMVSQEFRLDSNCSYTIHGVQLSLTESSSVNRLTDISGLIITED
jgi:cytochrome c biogenesis factor